MQSFAAVILFAAAASAATVPVYQNVYPEVQVKDAGAPAVATSHVYRSSVVSPAHVAYAAQPAAYAAQPAAYAAQPAYVAQPAYAAQSVFGAQPAYAAYAAQPAYVAPTTYAAQPAYGFAQPAAVHGYYAQQSYVAPIVRV